MADYQPVYTGGYVSAQVFIIELSIRGKGKKKNATIAFTPLHPPGGWLSTLCFSLVDFFFLCSHNFETLSYDFSFLGLFPFPSCCLLFFFFFSVLVCSFVSLLGSLSVLTQARTTHQNTLCFHRRLEHFIFFFCYFSLQYLHWHWNVIYPYGRHTHYSIILL